MGGGSNGKRRNSEKRKEKSRDAARSRRGKESEVFSDLSEHLPIAPAVLATLDKASTMRVAISHLKLRKLLGPEPSMTDQPKGMERMLDTAYMQSLNGILMVIAREGDMVYMSENCSHHLGLSQIELIGQSLFDFSNPADKRIIDDVLEKMTPNDTETDFDFFMSLKCTLTSKGKNINLKSATYKVMHCTGRCVTVREDDKDKGLTCLILVAEPIPHPVNIEIFLDSKTHLTTHRMDMSMMFCDPKLCKLLGFEEEELTDKCIFDLYHAGDVQHLHSMFKIMKEMGQVRTGIYRLLAKGGGYVYVDTEATVIYNAAHTAVQHIVCVNYIVSGVEEPNLILADFQMPEQQQQQQPPPLLPDITEDNDVILATESIFSLNTEDGNATADDSCYGSQVPSAGDVMVAFDYNDQDPKLVGVESLLMPVDPASGNELMMSPPHSESSASVLPQSTATSVGSPPDLIDISSDSESEAMTSRQTLIIDPEEVDMCQRAPYISMSGDDDLLFTMELPGSAIEELSVGANVMLGKTESVFNSLPEHGEEDEEGGERKPYCVPFHILRQLASHSKKREFSETNVHNPALATINKPTETNRLETGPPSLPCKRPRLTTITMPAAMGDVSEKVRAEEGGAVGGSSVLMNLLLSGEDVQNGYMIPQPLPKAQSPPQPSTSSSSAGSSPISEHGGTLRDLLTCPLEPSSPSSSSSSSYEKIIYPAPSAAAGAAAASTQFITFNPAIMKVLGLTASPPM